LSVASSKAVNLVWACLAGVKRILAAVATDPKRSFAFINKIAMTVALSQFRIALRRRGKRGIARRQNE